MRDNAKYADHPPHGRGETWPHKVWAGVPGSKPDRFYLFFFFLKPKVSWSAATRNMRLSAGTREPLLHAFRPPVHSTRREQTRLTRKAEKCKFPADLWPSGGEGGGGGDPGWGAALHAYRRGSNRVYDCIISSSPSSPLHPSVDTGSHRAGADTPDITHSLASEVPLSGDCWRKKENRSIHLPWAWQVIFTWNEIWAVPARWIP